MERKLKFLMINPMAEGLGKVLQLAIGNPTLDKTASVIKNYKHKNHYLIGCINDRSMLIGLVGLKVTDGVIEILHLSVIEQFRGQGIVSNLIRHISMYFSCCTLMCETDKNGLTFYQKFGFKIKEVETQWGIRYKCMLNKKSIELDNHAILILNNLSLEINKLYGHVEQPGDNFGEPAINSGPCGPFAYAFALYWNTYLQKPCKIAFLLQTNKNCWHIPVILPNGKLFDGGIGVHDISRYKDKNLNLVVMDSFEIDLLESHAYGLERSYPRYCPDFSLEKIICVISKNIDLLR